MDYLNAFLCGGILCAIGQILIDKTQLTPARILTGYVVAGVILGALGIYEPIVQWGGSGATVPLTGFGYNLAKGVSKAVGEKGWMGVLTGGLTATAGGIAAAVLFGFLMAMLFRPGDKRLRRNKTEDFWSAVSFIFRASAAQRQDQPRPRGLRGPLGLLLGQIGQGVVPFTQRRRFRRQPLQGPGQTKPLPFLEPPQIRQVFASRFKLHGLQQGNLRTSIQHAVTPPASSTKSTFCIRLRQPSYS